jgi:hypothetical protein
MILRPRKKGKNTVDSGFGVGTRSYGRKNIFYTHDGVQVRERKLGDRILYSLDSPQEWMHPWYTTVGYFTQESGVLKNTKDEAIAGFAAVVNPGFVNGIDPVCPGAQKIIVGEEKTSNNLLSGGDPVEIKEQPGLLDGPLIPLYGFVFIGKGIPAGLKDLGAEERSSDPNTIAPTNPDARYVATTGIYLQCARPTSKMDVSEFNYPMDSIDYSVSFDTAALDRYGVRATIGVGAPPPNLKPSIADKLTGGYQDPGLDCWMIATVYLLSPKNPITDKDGNPVVTEAWVPYVKHHTYWNLEYRWRLVVPQNKPLKTDMSLLPITGRYGLAGQGMVAAGASEVNRLMAAVLNAKNTNGKFWTV